MNPENDTNPAFCPAPWTSIYVSPTGDIDSCCISKNQLGTTNDNIESLIQGPKNLEIKRSMMDGQFVSGCRACDFPPDVKTLRHVYMDWFKDLHQSPGFGIDSFSLKYIDLRWRNTCNSACVYCGEAYSSLWAQELNLPQKINNEKINKLKEFIEPRIPDLEHVYLAGGEPLIVKDNEWFLERLLKSNPACKIRVNTNLTAIDNAVFELLTQFDQVQWIISGESIGEKYEYIRYGSKWDDYQSNLKKLQEKVSHKNHEITFLMVYCALSAPYIRDYIEFLYSQGLYKVSLGYYNQGTGGWCDPRNLPEEVEQKCKKDIKNLMFKKRSLAEDLVRTLNSMAVIMDTPYTKDTELLMSNLDMLDKRRGLDSRKIFPEIYQ